MPVTCGLVMMATLATLSMSVFPFISTTPRAVFPLLVVIDTAIRQLKSWKFFHSLSRTGAGSSVSPRTGREKGEVTLVSASRLNTVPAHSFVRKWKDNLPIILHTDDCPAVLVRPVIGRLRERADFRVGQPVRGA